MVEMVEILDERLGKRSVEQVRYVINNLLHLVIVKYGVISLELCISTRLRLVTILSLLVKYLVIFHADPCNKSYISREISIEHPSVGLASLAQLFTTFATPTTPLRIKTSLVSSGQTLYQAAPLETNTSLLQRFTAESCRDSGGTRCLEEAEQQAEASVDVLILLFNLLTQFPFVSFPSVSILSLLPFSILSLLPLHHPFFLF